MDMLGIHVPLFMFPVISVAVAPLAAFVLLKIAETFVSIRHFSTVWLGITYALLIIQAIAISVMLSRVLPSS